MNLAQFFCITPKTVRDKNRRQTVKKIKHNNSQMKFTLMVTKIVVVDPTMKAIYLVAKDPDVTEK